MWDSELSVARSSRCNLYSVLLFRSDSQLPAHCSCSDLHFPHPLASFGAHLQKPGGDLQTDDRDERHTQSDKSDTRGFHGGNRASSACPGGNRAGGSATGATGTTGDEQNHAVAKRAQREACYEAQMKRRRSAEGVLLVSLQDISRPQTLQIWEFLETYAVLMVMKCDEYCMITYNYSTTRLFEFWSPYSPNSAWDPSDYSTD